MAAQRKYPEELRERAVKMAPAPSTGCGGSKPDPMHSIAKPAWAQASGYPLATVTPGPASRTRGHRSCGSWFH